MASDSSGGQSAIADLPAPPYPEALPGPAHLHFLFLAMDPVGYGRRLEESPDVCRYWLPGTGDVYNLARPDLMKRVVLTDRDAFAKSDDFSVAFGEGLLTVEGEEWQQQRNILQPLFTRSSVLGYADGMVDQVQRRVDRWSDGQTLELQDEFTQMTLEVLAATILGRELDLDGDRALRQAAESLHDWFKPTSYVLPHWIPTPARRRFNRGKQTIRQEAQRLLDEKHGDAPTDPSEATDLLSLLVGLRESDAVEHTQHLTDERLRDQMVTIIFAGHDTTTTTLTFAYWAIANHPDVREAFHAEVDALEGPPTVDDLDALPVTESIVTETLRMFPAVYQLPRVATRDVAVDGYRIPEGAAVHVPILALHRDERYYDEPDVFRLIAGMGH
ncbi:MAG: cytochrome P450 [Natrialbaceae archaeon]|nr:cytochrome P450 [Natrialbaceae archaeon]